MLLTVQRSSSRVWALTLVALAGFQIFVIFIQDHLGWKMIFNNIYCFNSWDDFLHDGKCLQVGSGYSQMPTLVASADS